MKAAIYMLCLRFTCVWNRLPNMCYLIDICFICFENSNNLTPIKSQAANGTSFGDKLQYFLPEFKINWNIPKFICAKCGRNLSESYEFKQKCLQNITTYEKYAQQVTTKNGCYKYLSDIIRSDFVCKDEINYDANVLESQTETIVDTSPRVEEFMIKEEVNEELIPDKESKLLLHEIKQEITDLDDTYNKNENIIENAQISNDSVFFSTGNENEKEQNDKKLYKCEICNKSLKWGRDLKRHQLIHTNSKPFTCEVCNKAFKRSQHLKEHHMLHTGEKPFACGICNKLFRHFSDLKKHKRVHTDEKPYTCEICNDSFRSYSGLKYHKLLHNDQKLFTCEVCKQLFRQLSHMKRHKCIHSGEKKFTCAVCNKSFKHSGSLKTHQITHTGEKPFTCDLCNRSFTTKHSLQCHLRRHSNLKFECAECAEKFVCKPSLKKHIFNVHRKE